MPDDGLKAAEDMLTAAPGLNLIFAKNDSMCLGAITGKENEIKVIGIDGEMLLLKESGQLIWGEGNYCAFALTN